MPTQMHIGSDQAEPAQPGSGSSVKLKGGVTDEYLVGPRKARSKTTYF
jgi:hypothetical protein